jgi:hypothetical protein
MSVGRAREPEVRWETAFVAVSAALGEPYDRAIDALGDAGAIRAGEIVHALRASRRSARARALANALASVAREIDAMALR